MNSKLLVYLNKCSGGEGIISRSKKFII